MCIKRLMSTVGSLQCGYLSMPNAVMHSVTWTDMNMLDLGEHCNPPSHYEFNFTASQSLSTPAHHLDILPSILNF